MYNLAGTPKQIAWADDIIKVAKPLIEAQIKDWEEGFVKCPKPGRTLKETKDINNKLRVEFEIMTGLLLHTEAEWWIVNRHLFVNDYAEIVKRLSFLAYIMQYLNNN